MLRRGSTRCRIGVQVTEYHGVEGKDGSSLRAQEKSDTVKCIIRTYAVPADATGGLTKRIGAKLAKAKRYTFEEFAEVWLLVAAFLPMLGAVAATSALPISVTPEWLEQNFGERLRGSKYRRVFFHVHLCHALYEWSAEKGWQVIREPEKLTPGGTDGQLGFKRYLDDPELLRDSAGWALREARRVLQELREGSNSARTDERQQGVTS